MAMRRLKKTLYKQKCFLAFGHGFSGSAADLSEHIGCSINSAKKYMMIWNAMNKDEKQMALRKAIKDIKFMQQIHGAGEADVWGSDEEQQEKPKPKPAVHWGFRTPYSVQKQQRSRSLISHY